MPRVRKNIPDGYLTVRDVAERLNISTVWVYELIKTKAIKTYRQGVTLIRESDVEKLEIPEEIKT